MTIIEGIGDEIIHIGIAIGVVILGMLAWWSTHIRDVALYRTIVIVERNRRNNNNNNNVIDNNQTEPLGGIPVSRSVHTTLRTFNGIESEVDSTPIAEEASPLSEVDNQEEEEEGPSPQSSLQSERPLLVGDYVNPSLQNPPSPNPPTTDNPDQETDTPAGGETEPGDDSEIRIRLKYLNDEERVVDGKLNELLGDFKKRHFRSELSSNKVVRLIYNGHILAQDRSTLGACGVFNNCVIHCLVHPRRNQSHPSTNEGTRRQTGHAPHHNQHETTNGKDGGTTNDRGDEWGDLGGK
ncbi:hypothetical protein WDU94_006927 [Cyamophila willieti]